MKRFRWAALAAAAFAFSACGNGSVGGTHGGGNDAGSGGDAGNQGGGGDGGSGGDGGPNGGTTTFGGDIEAVELLAPGPDGGAPSQSYSVTADFYPNVGPGGSSCSGASVGSCCYSPPAGGGGSAPIGAGTLTVKDGQVTLGTLPFDPTNGYGLLTSATWMPGDTLSVTAPGDVVDAFVVSSPVPAALAGLSPSLASGALTISVSQPWTFAWTPGSPAGQSMLVTLGPAPNATGQSSIGSITCTPNDSDGTLTVDASLLANFQSGQAAQLAVARINAGQASPANGSVLLRVSEMVEANATFGP